jgi:hypothetical protein
LQMTVAGASFAWVRAGKERRSAARATDDTPRARRISSPFLRVQIADTTRGGRKPGTSNCKRARAIAHPAGASACGCPWREGTNRRRRRAEALARLQERQRTARRGREPGMPPRPLGGVALLECPRNCPLIGRQSGGGRHGTARRARQRVAAGE